MNIKQKIRTYLAYSRVSQTAAEDALHWGRGTISKDGTISSEKLAEFVLQYKNVSSEWLLRGNGEMLLDVFEMENGEHNPDWEEGFRAKQETDLKVELDKYKADQLDSMEKSLNHELDKRQWDAEDRLTELKNEWENDGRVKLLQFGKEIGQQLNNNPEKLAIEREQESLNKIFPKSKEQEERMEKLENQWNELEDKLNAEYGAKVKQRAAELQAEIDAMEADYYAELEAGKAQFVAEIRAQQQAELEQKLSDREALIRSRQGFELEMQRLKVLKAKWKAENDAKLEDLMKNKGNSVPDLSIYGQEVDRLKQENKEKQERIEALEKEFERSQQRLDKLLSLLDKLNLQ